MLLSAVLQIRLRVWESAVVLQPFAEVVVSHTLCAGDQTKRDRLLETSSL